MAYKGTAIAARLACVFVFAGMSAYGAGQISTDSATSAAISSFVTNFNNGDACVAQTLPPTHVLFGTSKKVFAHYFFPYPVSLDNAAPANE